MRLLRNAPRHRLGTVLAATAASAALVGCGSNINAQTQEWYDPTDGANTDVEQSLQGVAVRNLIVVSDGTDATVLAAFVNTSTETDEVVDITVDGTPAQIDGSLEVDPDQAVLLGPDGAATALVQGADLVPGGIVPVDVGFANAPEVTLDAVVRAPTGDFEGLGPGSG